MEGGKPPRDCKQSRGSCEYVSILTVGATIGRPPKIAAHRGRAMHAPTLCASKAPSPTGCFFTSENLFVFGRFANRPNELP